MGDWRRILDVDLVATARLIDALRPLANGGTAIVCFASMAAHLSAQTRTPAADAAVDDPLAAGFFDALPRRASAKTATNPGNRLRVGEARRAASGRREAVTSARSARGSVRSRPA